MNFITYTYEGPGKVREEREAEAIGLDTDESFSQETAVLYEPSKKVVLMEYNRAGIGAGALAAYLHSFATEATVYEIKLILDNEASAKAREHEEIRAFHIEVETGEPTDQDHERGLDIIKAFGKEYGGESITVIVKAGRARSLDKERLWNRFDKIIPFRKEAKVTTLRQKSTPPEEDQAAWINLLQQDSRLEAQLTVDNRTRNIRHKERWNELIRMINRFNS